MPEELEDVVEAPEENAAPAEEQVETPSESAPDENAPQPEVNEPGRLQKRIDKLTRKAAEAQREAERWREEALRVKPQAEPKPTTPKQVPSDKPKAADFEDAEEFVEALTDWKLEQRQKAEREAHQQQEQQTSQQQLQSKVADDLAKARAELPDFDEVMEDATLPGNNPTAVRLIQESEDSAKLFYNLVKDEASMKRIWALNDPAKIARELGKIEARITSAPVAAPPAPSTRTPQPIRPVAASRQAVATQVDDDTEWFRKQRSAQR